jgi:hypothetical protein
MAVSSAEGGPLASGGHLLACSYCPRYVNRIIESYFPPNFRIRSCGTRYAVIRL